MYKITHDRDNCIMCGACAAVCPEFWEMADDGKSKLKGSKNNTLELKDIKCNQKAAEGCPVSVIHIEKDGKKII